MLDKIEDFIIKNENGESKTYKVLLTFDMKNKSYVVYTDSQLDIDDEINVYYASYKDGDLSDLEIVEEKEEIEIIEDIISDFENTLKK